MNKIAIMRLLFLCFGLVIIASATYAQKSQFEGFMGIPLGSSKVFARARLDSIAGGRCTKDTVVGNLSALIYVGGTFGGFEVKKRMLMFYHDSLFDASVSFPVTASDALDRWQELVDVLISKYGKPKTEVGSRYRELSKKRGESDEDIYAKLDQDFFFIASWEFKPRHSHYGISCRVGYSEDEVTVWYRDIILLARVGKENQKSTAKDF